MTKSTAQILGFENALIVSRNEFGTIFVEMDGVLIAVGMPMSSNRAMRGILKRGFWNKMTQQHVPAAKFTPRNVKANPGMVIDFLQQTGTLTVASVVVTF